MCVWSVVTGEQIGPTIDSANGAFFTKHERQVLSWSASTIRRTDVVTAQHGPIMKHDGSVGAIFLTKDGKRVVSFSSGGGDTILSGTSFKPGTLRLAVKWDP